MENYEKYEIKPDNGPIATFEGRKVASVNSERPDVEFWMQFDAYKTRSGKILIVKSGVPRDSSLSRKVSWRSFDTESEMIEKMGTRMLASRLYDAMGITKFVID